MWGEAFSVHDDDSVLLPAPLIYFPWLASEYQTRSLYMSQSNGLASGASFLEAVIHGLYEVIERHYIGLEEIKKMNVYWLTPDDYDPDL